MSRPKTELDLPEGWEAHVLELYYEGASDVEVKAWIHQTRGTFSNDLWDRWLIDEPTFSETVKKGKMMAEAWWQRHGRKNIGNKDFNSTLWYMNMKNRYGWADNNRTEISGGIDVKQITGMEIK